LLIVARPSCEFLALPVREARFRFDRLRPSVPDIELFLDFGAIFSFSLFGIKAFIRKSKLFPAPILTLTKISFSPSTYPLLAGSLEILQMTTLFRFQCRVIRKTHVGRQMWYPDVSFPK